MNKRPSLKVLFSFIFYYQIYSLSNIILDIYRIKCFITTLFNSPIFNT